MVGAACLAVGASAWWWIDPVADWIWERVLPQEIMSSDEMDRGLRWRVWTRRGDRKEPREYWSNFPVVIEFRHPLAGWIWLEGAGRPTFQDAADPEFDIDGDGVAERFVWVWNGGAHCCETMYVVNTRSTLRPLLMVGGVHSGVTPVDLEGDGIAEFELRDWTFAYWSASFADSPSMPVVIRWSGEEWWPVVSAMRAPVPRGEELEPCERVNRESPRSRPDHCEVFWGRMLELMYSGNEASAWVYFDRVWPDDVPGKAEFKKDFLDELERSPWWPKIRAAYSRGE